MLYLLLISRLYYTFHGTYYRLSQKTIISLTTLVIITTIISIIYLGTLLFQLFGVYDIKQQWESPLLISWIVNDIILNATLLVLFLRKLKDVIIAQSENNMEEKLLQCSRENDQWLLNLDTSQPTIL